MDADHAESPHGERTRDDVKSNAKASRQAQHERDGGVHTRGGMLSWENDEELGGNGRRELDCPELGKSPNVCVNCRTSMCAGGP